MEESNARTIYFGLGDIFDDREEQRGKRVNLNRKAPPKNWSRKPHYVYMFTAIKRKRPVVKIGHAHDLRKRLMTLRSQHRLEDIKLVCAFLKPSRLEAHHAEKQWQRELVKYRIKGEWFRLQAILPEALSEKEK